ncbi:hypothetical protein [Streptomyces sp. NPDC051569]|uniref:hypothetical protein n=1 Tax=Streptomyces sp. NPDC051569 TaxID=3365661 RepID=UPI00379562A0
MSTKPFKIYMVAVLAVGLIHAGGFFDKDVTFLVCLAATVPCSVLTAPLLFSVLAPALHLAAIPPDVGQVVVDVGYAVVGGLLNVLLVRAAVAMSRAFRASRADA